MGGRGGSSATDQTGSPSLRHDMTAPSVYDVSLYDVATYDAGASLDLGRVKPVAQSTFIDVPKTMAVNIVPKTTGDIPYPKTTTENSIPKTNVSNVKPNAWAEVV